MKYPARHTARGIIVKDGKMLVFERWRRDFLGRTLHYYAIPGGGIDEGETPSETVVRELKEEMSVEVRVDRLVYEQETDQGLYSYFLCSIVSGVPVFNQGSEEARRGLFLNRYKVVWLPFNVIAKSNFPPTYKEALEVILPKI